MYYKRFSDTQRRRNPYWVLVPFFILLAIFSYFVFVSYLHKIYARRANIQKLYTERLVSHLLN